MKKLFKKFALMVVALLTFSVGSNYTVKEVKAAVEKSEEYTCVAPSEDNQENFSHDYGYFKMNWDANKQSSKVRTYSNPIRVYANHKVTFSIADTSLVESITKLVITTSGGKYVDGSVTTWDNAKATASDSIVTVTPTDGTKSFTLTASAQTRWSKIQFSYTLVEGKTSVSISGDNYTELGKTVTLNALTENFDGSVIWSSSNENVATVSNGVVTPITVGRTTITAIAGEATSEVEFKVFPVANSELSVEEALKVCEVTGLENSPFIYSTTGTIESITEYNSEYDNSTLTINDGLNSILAYRMLGGSELSIGDKITVTGNLINYKGNTPEFAAGCKYVKSEDTNENLSLILESLNKVNSNMSLSYKYTETTDYNYNVVDKLDNSTTGVTGTSYAEWNNKTSNTTAVYAGQSAGSNSSIQLRSNNSNSGVITTTSGGKVLGVVVEWNSNTGNGRTLNVYGSNTAYTSPTELYNSNNQGDLLGTIVKGESTELVIEGDYEYIGLRSASGAMYLTSISIEWKTENATEVKTMSDSNFLIKCCIDKTIDEIENIDSFGIRVTANNTEVDYNNENSYSWNYEAYNEKDYYYVIINLGDIINNMDRLNTEFTVQAYVEVEGVRFASELTKTYSVASMVDTYYNEEGITEVEHLYNYLVKKGLITEEEAN